MIVFPYHTRPDERSQLRGRAACRVVPGALENRGAFPSDGVLPDLTDLYRSEIRWAVGVGVRHATESHIIGVQSSGEADGGPYDPQRSSARSAQAAIRSRSLLVSTELIWFPLFVRELFYFKMTQFGPAKSPRGFWHEWSAIIPEYHASGIGLDADLIIDR